MFPKGTKNTWENKAPSWIHSIQISTQRRLNGSKESIQFTPNTHTHTHTHTHTYIYIYCMNRASAFEWHKRFKEGRESVRDDERCGRSKEVNTTELIGQRVRVRVIIWGFKGVQEEIPSEEASTLQIGSVSFPPGQFTSPQLHPCHRLFDQDGHQDSSLPFL